MTQTTDAALVEPTQDDRAMAFRIVSDWRPNGWPAKENELAHLLARYRASAGQKDATQAADTIEAQARLIEALEGAGKRALAVLADLETNHPDCMGWAAPYPSTTPCIKLEADALRAALDPTP